MSGSRYSDPAWRAVEHDRLLEHGLRLRLWQTATVMVGSTAAASIDGCGNGHGDGNRYDGYGDGCNDGDTVHGGGCGDSLEYEEYNESGSSERFENNMEQIMEAEMVPGLAIVVTPGGSYPYVRIGWLRHREGDWWELCNCRVIKRFGQGNAALAGLAARGPVTGTELLESSPVEHVHALHAIRVIPANPEAWGKECPKPAGS